MHKINFKSELLSQNIKGTEQLQMRMRHCLVRMIYKFTTPPSPPSNPQEKGKKAFKHKVNNSASILKHDQNTCTTLKGITNILL